MKRTVSILLVIVLLLCLVACAVSESEVKLSEKNNADIFIWTDEETGVQYVVYGELHGQSGAGGITPRLNADGTLYVTPESENEK